MDVVFMSLKVDLLKDAQLEVLRELLIVRLNHPFKVLSSAVLNGGLTYADAIVNVNVPKDYDHRDPKGYIATVCLKKGLNPEKTVGLMTAVDMSNTSFKIGACKDLKIAVVITAGTSNAVAAGDRYSQQTLLNTVNIIALVDGVLSDSCLVELVKTITEAKTLAFRELDIRSKISRKPATGTSTDSIVIAVSQQGSFCEFAGTATPLGQLASTLTLEAVKEAVEKQDKISPKRPVLKRLIEHGFPLSSFIEQSLQLNDWRRMTSSQAEKLLEVVCQEEEFAAMLLASIRLDEDIALGCVPDRVKDGLRRKAPSLIKALNAFCSEAFKVKRQAKTPEILVLDEYPFTSSFLQSVLHTVMLKKEEGLGENGLEEA